MTMNATGPWRTVLIESQCLLRTLLAKAVFSDKRFVLMAQIENGSEALAACTMLRPKLVVIGIDMPDCDGIDLARSILKELPKSRVLALSNSRDPFTLNRIVEAGIHGYVAKSEPLETLEEAILEVASGGSYLPAALCENQARLQSNAASFAKILSRREQEILCYVASGHTSKSIADRLRLSYRSVETYRYRIKQKLKCDNLAQLIDYAFRNGFVSTNK